jgi:predicted ferric reductase
MKLQSALLASALLSSSLVSAAEGYHHYSHAEITLIACKYSVYNTAQYCTTDTAAGYKCVCKNQPAMGSILNCLFDNLGEYNEKGEKIFEEYCHESANVTLTTAKIEKSYENATQYLVDPKDVEGFNKTAIHYEPMIYNKTLFRNSYISTKIRRENFTDALYMGAGLLGYWAAIFLFATIYNFAVRVGFVQKNLKSKFINSVRKHLTLPSLFGNKAHTRPVQFLKVFQGFIPTRLESLVIFGYFVLIFVFSGVRYSYYDQNTIWATVDGQRARYPGDRTAILLLFSLQLTYLFVGRNNFLIWATGWKQSTFITYHKWISRMNFILTLIHGVSMHFQSTGIGKFQSRLKTYWYKNGIASGILMGLIVFLACRQLRAASYEVFLAIHLACAAAFMATAWRHSYNFGYQMFFYPMVAVWAFDRFLRLVRLFLFGVQKAKVTVVSDEVLKIVVPTRKFWKAYPGAFGYIHFLRPTTFFQSHPFSIVECNENEIVFYSKIKGGLTSGIARYLSAQPDKTGYINISVEGPYGHSVQMKRYDTVLFYVGGTGIAAPLAHALQLVRLGAQQHIKLYWTIRSIKSMEWIKEELSQLGSHIKIIVYITRPDSAVISDKTTDSESVEKEEKSDDILSIYKGLDFIEFRNGRPNIAELVKADLEESTGNVSILTTAHNSLVDDVRDAVANNLNAAKGRVDYFEDLQGNLILHFGIFR